MMHQPLPIVRRNFWATVALALALLCASLPKVQELGLSTLTSAYAGETVGK